ncbi:hypothetical protein HNO88_002501 [Novosphingobium chloroacetimidivorans]|uniref:UrcA family protein n=1 Tax=Novosphingobium chloroacetimidivorans TaxID=1428314 RepID=A0A7W7KAD6_9SPHN|nr:hypothetical protein [Novosphingobium chloroacetimidivorans]MBB4859172.1 hypothetical protein [Novosphingobium chloroacetimidivorans]
MVVLKLAAVTFACSASTAALAQDDFPIVDWGPTIQTEAMNSAMDYAARQGSGTTSKPRTRTAQMTPERRAKLKSLCSQIRQHAANGAQHPRLAWSLGKCNSEGL